MKIFFHLCITATLILVNLVALSQELENKSIELNSPEETFTLQGELWEKGSRVPLGKMNLYLLPEQLKITSDEYGRFEVPQVKFGEHQIIITAVGYYRLAEDFYFEQTTSEQNKIRKIILYLEKESYSGFETTVVAKKKKKDDSQKSLDQAQFYYVPGSAGDPVKAIQNLPGVNRVSGFSSQIVIQGSAPTDTKYHLDGHEIPLVFHFGGLTSVLIPESIERVDYLSTGYGVDYSRALGGVVNLNTIKPDLGLRQSKGFFFVDTFKAGGLFETKLDEQSELLVSGRYSYIGMVLRSILKSNEQFDLTVAPEFSDLSGIYTRRIDERNEIKVVGLYSRDVLEFLLKEPIKQDPLFRGEFETETKFYRLIPQWTRRIGPQELIHLSTGIGEDRISVNIGDRFFNLVNKLLTVRGEYQHKPNSNLENTFGFDNQYSNSSVAVKLPIVRNEGGISNPFSAAETREVSVSGKNNNLGIFYRGEIHGENSPWTFIPMMRADQFGLTKEKLYSPRLTVRHQFSESSSARIAGGIYYQPPAPQEIDTVFGNPRVKSPRAIHALIGFDKDFRQGTDRGFIFEGSLFNKNLDHLVIQSAKFVERDGAIVPEIYNNDGKGKVLGMEALIRGEFKPFSGWVSYTLSRSTRWNPDREEYVFEYDQTHNFNIVGSYDLPRDWKISIRYRFVTGNPETPVVGAVYDSDNDVYIPIRGPIYSHRLKDFQQLDLRIDKKIIDTKAIWSVYLDVQNLLNTKNSEGVRYAYDYSVREEVSGLPVLPSLGVRGEF